MNANTQGLIDLILWKNTDEIPCFVIKGDDNKYAQLMFAPFIFIVWCLFVLASLVMYIPVELYNNIYKLIKLVRD